MFEKIKNLKKIKRSIIPLLALCVALLVVSTILVVVAVTTLTGNCGTVAIDGLTSTTTLSLSQSTITVGGSITATATVTSGATSTIIFSTSSDNGGHWTQIGATKTLSGNSATSDSYSPVVGTYLIKADYAGDTIYQPSTSTTHMLTVNAVVLQSNVKITAASFNGQASGTINGAGTVVSFADSHILVNGQTTLSITVTNTGTGPSTITASVSGQGSVLTFTPDLAPTSVAAGGSATFTWTVNAIARGTASPVVTFTAS